MPAEMDWEPGTPRWFAMALLAVSACAFAGWAPAAPRAFSNDPAAQTVFRYGVPALGLVAAWWAAGLATQPHLREFRVPAWTLAWLHAAFALGAGLLRGVETLTGAGR